MFLLGSSLGRALQGALQIVCSDLHTGNARFVMGWSDPEHFGHGTAAKSGVAPAHHGLLPCAKANIAPRVPYRFRASLVHRQSEPQGEPSDDGGLSPSRHLPANRGPQGQADDSPNRCRNRCAAQVPNVRAGNISSCHPGWSRANSCKAFRMLRPENAGVLPRGNADQP